MDRRQHCFKVFLINYKIIAHHYRGKHRKTCLIDKFIKLITMKTSHYLILFFLAALVFSSCRKDHIHPSHHIITEERFTGTFHSLDVSDAIDVDVLFTNGTYSVFIEADDNIMPYVLTDVTAGVLYIRLKNSICIGPHASIKVHISNPFVEAVDISGASRVEFNNSQNIPYFKLSTSGASMFQGEFYCTTFDADMSGASVADIWGAADYANIKLSGASKLGDYSFSINTLDIVLSGASTASLTVNQVMNIEASGASSFYYKGNGLINDLNLSGASVLKKK